MTLNQFKQKRNISQFSVLTDGQHIELTVPEDDAQDTKYLKNTCGAKVRVKLKKSRIMGKINVCYSVPYHFSIVMHQFKMIQIFCMLGVFSPIVSLVTRLYAFENVRHDNLSCACQSLSGKINVWHVCVCVRVFHDYRVVYEGIRFTGTTCAERRLCSLTYCRE